MLRLGADMVEQAALLVRQRQRLLDRRLLFPLADAQVVHHVRAARHEPCAVAEQAMAPGAVGRENAAGHDKNFPALIRGEIDRDERAAAGGRFDDDHAETEAGDDPVAGGKIRRVRLPARRIVGDERALLDDPRRQVLVLGRVNDVDAAAKHGDRSAARLDRRLVRGRVDSARQPGNDRDSRLGELGRESSGDFPSIARRAPCADDRERGIVVRTQGALHVENGRRRGNLRQQSGILRIRDRDRRDAEARHPVELSERIETGASPGHALDGALVEHLT